jgi:hypothetical protein
MVHDGSNDSTSYDLRHIGGPEWRFKAATTRFVYRNNYTAQKKTPYVNYVDIINYPKRRISLIYYRREI